MPTPAYSPYIIGNPDGTTGSGSTFATQLQNNLNAMLHGAVMGEMPGWNMAVTIGSGTAGMPQFMTYSNGVYRLRLTITWNGTTGNVNIVLFEWSNDSGGTYSTMKTVTYSYDGSQNLTAAVWT